MLLTQLAYALVADEGACALNSVSGSLPASGAVGVAVDVVPTVWVSSGGCGSVEWEATLVAAEAPDDPLVAVIQDISVEGELIELEAELAPDTAYVIRVLPTDGGGELSEIPFTTGTGVTTPLAGRPEIVELGADWFDGRSSLWATVSPAAGEGALVLESGGAPLGAAILGEAATETWVYGTVEDPEPPAEVCAIVRQRDLAANWAESEEVCVAPTVQDPACGCSTSRSGAGYGALIALLFIRRRR